MVNDARFNEAIARIDGANREDPRTQIVDGQAQSRELLFSRRVFDWIGRLADAPSEELLLAARAHTLRRWRIPRDRYPMTTIGYHQWRDALAQFHAEEAEAILRDVGYPGETVEKVRVFITRKNWPADREACVLEDADCLVFLETKLGEYLDDWDEAKTVRILKRTLRKMTPDARTRAMQLPLGDRERELLGRVASPSGA